MPPGLVTIRTKDKLRGSSCCKFTSLALKGLAPRTYLDALFSFEIRGAGSSKKTVTVSEGRLVVFVLLCDLVVRRDRATNGQWLLNTEWLHTKQLDQTAEHN